MLILLTYKLFKFNLHNKWFFPYTVFNFLAAIKKLSEMLDSNPELLWYSHAVYIYILYSVLYTVGWIVDIFFDRTEKVK